MKRSRRSESSLSATELAIKLNEGGWIISDGNRVDGISFPMVASPKLPVVKASLLGETLKIEAGNFSFEVSIDNIVLTDPWTVEIRHTFMRNQQRKKIEGGGWHEVPAVGVELRMSNPALEKSVRKAREEERARQETEELVVRREQFIASINSRFTGKNLIKIEVVDKWKLRLLFEDNSTIEIASETCDCYYGKGSAVVNDISLQGYRRPEYVS